ncbi:MAG: potassium/proton antiporter [Chloroflexi bacterium]|nr:potassium/proton antiporter [Chloroflexota bacterium]
MEAWFAPPVVTEVVLIGAAALLLFGVLASKISDRFGVPVLLVFLALGMLAGSDGPGGIYFDDPALAQFVAVVALVFILFGGGLSTGWSEVRPVLAPSLTLATVGVLFTALVMGVFAHLLLGMPLLEGMLLGSIVSSTDAAAVFAVLRSKSVGLRGNLRPLLELESGSNDPMAVFLTTGLIQILTQPEAGLAQMVWRFVLQMVLGGALGYLAGRATAWLTNRIKLGHDGLYPVLTFSMVLLAYGLVSVAGGNGFLAVYVQGIVLGNSSFVRKRTVLRFHDGVSWLMQIVMFLTLGLLVFPSRLAPVAGMSLALVACLMFIARPLAVFLTLLPTRLSLREKAFVSWVGLRGAVPIVLATYPLVAGLPDAAIYFNVVFFIVLASVVVQGTTLPYVARLLKVDAPIRKERNYPIEYNHVGGFASELREAVVTAGAHAAGRSIADLSLPPEFLFVLIARNDEFMIPSGETVLQPGDTVLALAEKQVFAEVSGRLTARAESRVSDNLL